MACHRLLAAALIAALCIAPANAAEPELAHVYPVAAQRGAHMTVAIAGKVAPWPPQVWIDTSGVTFTPTPVTGVFAIEIAPEAAPGPHLIRLYNDDGVSAPRFFIVSTEPELLEVEPNDNFRSPQKIAALPATVSGRLAKAGDVDCFAAQLKCGQTLIASLEAYVLGSTFDGMMRIVDSDGHECAFNHDGRTLDPQLAWTAPRDGEYIVQVTGFAYPASNDVRLAGGEGCVYRLHLSTGPAVRQTVPLAVQRGRRTRVQLLGWNLVSQTALADATQSAAGAASAELPLKTATADSLLLPLSDVREAIETEPNDTAKDAESLDVPGAVTGCISHAEDEDRFVFTAVKQRVYDLQVMAGKAGSPLDAWLAIVDKDGKELARNDDGGGSRDPQLTWTAPADGIFTAAVGDLTHRGGEDFLYRLQISEAAPSVNATIASHSLKLGRGKSAELNVAVKRANGFAAKLVITAKNLPEGIAAPDVDVPEKAGEAAIKFTAAADAKAASQPFQLVLRELETGREHAVLYVMTSSSEDNGVPQGYSELVINSTDQLWLTVSVREPQ